MVLLFEGDGAEDDGTADSHPQDEEYESIAAPAAAATEAAMYATLRDDDDDDSAPFAPSAITAAAADVERRISALGGCLATVEADADETAPGVLSDIKLRPAAAGLQRCPTLISAGNLTTFRIRKAVRSNKDKVGFILGWTCIHRT